MDTLEMPIKMQVETGAAEYELLSVKSQHRVYMYLDTCIQCLFHIIAIVILFHKARQKSKTIVFQWQ